MGKTLTRVINYSVAGFIFVLPIFYLPFTTEMFSLNKNFLLYFFCGILAFLWAAKIIVEKEAIIKPSRFYAPLSALAIAYIISTYFISPNKAEAFIFPNETGTIIALFVFFFIAANNIEAKKITEYIYYPYIAIASLLGLINIYHFVGITSKMVPAWMQGPFWTPAENILSLVVVLTIALPLVIYLFIRNYESSTVKAALFGSGAIITLIGLIIAIYQIIQTPTGTTLFLPHKDAWAIALDSIKDNPFCGVGAGNYLSAFNHFRPFAFNQQKYWDTRFGIAPSFPLQLVTTTGLVGLGAYVLLIWQAIVTAIKTKTKDYGLLAAIGIAFVGQLLTPTTITPLLAFYVILIALDKKQKNSPIPVSRSQAYIATGIVCVAMGITLYLAGKVYTAEVIFRNSLVALAQNKGTQAYNDQIKAISLNPYSISYHISYSQVNLALATSIINKKEPTDQDRKLASDLLNQSIREAKIAISLNQSNALSWENLAQIYRSLMGISQGADQWAIISYRQAVANDPVSPRIRLNLGGLYYSLGNFAMAQQYFQETITLKPDFANAYYNLAASLREQKKYQEAYSVLQATINLLPNNSSDIQKVKAEIEEIAKKMPKEAAQEPTQPNLSGETQLTEPEPAPSVIISPPIELPEEAAPSVPQEETPTP